MQQLFVNLQYIISIYFWVLFYGEFCVNSGNKNGCMSFVEDCGLNQITVCFFLFWVGLFGLSYQNYISCCAIKNDILLFIGNTSRVVHYKHK